MNSTRRLFWIFVTLCGALWLVALIGGGRDSLFDLEWRQTGLLLGAKPFLARNSPLFTQLGSGLVLILIAALATIILFFRRRRRTALLLFMIFGGRLLIELQKVLIDRDRPGVPVELIAADTYSFPSGHAGNSMITFLAIALLLPVRQRNRAIAVGIALALALQVGASRVMLGVHWPTDVIGGWAFGLLWITICMRLATDRPDSDVPAPRRWNFRRKKIEISVDNEQG
jgi:undecaprenyl-diphosphatase